MTDKIPLKELDTLPTAAFVEKLGGVFEHSPWVAENVAQQRPFASIDALHGAMCAEVAAAGNEAQLTLIQDRCITSPIIRPKQESC